MPNRNGNDSIGSGNDDLAKKFLVVEITVPITVVYAREGILHETGRENVRGTNQSNQD